ncbi:MAG: single-stranded-DNA-specific exonuclease RecJ [Campylobacterales bacterium]|nr:single-stranded-DNA-specific exonuclease RecJ [Campylobacterales bacterium]
MSEKILQEIEQRLKSRFENSGGMLDLCDLPFPETLKDITKSASRIKEAIKKNEKIIIIGDYDVDGVVATTLLLDLFDVIEYQVDWFIPNRFKHGYGISTKILSYIEAHDLIITVDNGINANDVALWCKQRDKTLIITDHHTPKEILPEAFCIVNPKQESCNFVYQNICGAMVAWYLMAEIKKQMHLNLDLKAYLLLVAIASVADMMPLIHINRAVVKAGLKELQKSERAFVQSFKEQLQKEHFTSEDISFLIAPLLNSAGRMDDASLSVQFLRSKNIYDARALHQTLNEKNLERKNKESVIFSEALKFIINSDDKIIVAYKSDWHEGILGIVAARLVKHFEKPAIVLCKDKEGLLKGSGRSSKACDLFQSMQRCEELVEKFGGHTLAIGVSLQERYLEDFIQRLNEGYKINGEYLPENDYLCGLDFEHINLTLFDIFKKYEPYGEANPYPLFLAEKIEVINALPIGKNQEHMKYILRQGKSNFEAIEFRAKEPLVSGQMIDIIYKINRNSFRGEVTLQIIIENIILIYK